MTNINSGSTAQQMYDMCNEVIEVFSLDWNNCVTYSSADKNSVIGQRSSLLQKIRSAEVTKIFLTLVALAIYTFVSRKGCQRTFCKC